MSESALQAEPAVEQAVAAAYGREFWYVFIASCAFNTVSNLFVLFPLYVVDLGGGPSAIGAIVGTGSAFALFARPGVGPAIDRWGRRSTAMWFMLFDVFAVALYLTIHSLGWPIYAVRAIHGAIEGTARVALFAMVYDLLPEGREGEGMSLFSLCGMGPAAIAPALGEILVKRAGFSAFFCAAVLMLIAGAYVTSLIPDKHERPQHSDEIAPGQYAALVKNPELMTLWVMTLLFALSISSRLSFVAPFAYHKGIARVGGYFAIYSIAAVIQRVFGGRIMDRIGLERMIAPSMFVMGIGLAMIAGTGHMGMLSWAALIGGLGHGYLYPALSALVIARTPVSTMGRSSTLYTSLYDFGAMAGPYAFGVMGGYLGYGPIFIASGLIAVAGSAAFLVSEPRSRS